MLSIVKDLKAATVTNAVNIYQIALRVATAAMHFLTTSVTNGNTHSAPLFSYVTI